jgi:type VI secretion system protein ImpL
VPVLSFIGVLLLALVLWFEAPLLAFDGKEPFASARVRWIWIVLMFGAWAGWYGWKALAAYLANRRLMAGLAAANAPAASGADTAAAAAVQEQAVLQQRMQQALDFLRKAAPGKRTWGRQYLYQLPWYMFVGAPGSGKTTSLLHSGLRFPLAESMGPGAIGGVGGTRHCDWWFTDDAVLLDTAGRYTTQDSDAEVDQAGWHGFLGLLKKHRPRRPINGVIVALSVADLLQQGPAARQAQAAAIRARIKELHERLGSSFPIYVTVTKCDLLAGFMEYFDTLGREERAQVWGMTFPADAGAGRWRSFPARFLELEQAAGARAGPHAGGARPPAARPAVPLPAAVRRPGRGAEGLPGRRVRSRRATNRRPAARRLFHQRHPGGQSDRPRDGRAGGTFGLDRKVLPPNAVSGRSYFITALLRDLIFKEAGPGRPRPGRRAAPAPLALGCRWAGGPGGCCAARLAGNQLRAQPAHRERGRCAHRCAGPLVRRAAGGQRRCWTRCRC